MELWKSSFVVRQWKGEKKIATKIAQHADLWITVIADQAAEYFANLEAKAGVGLA